MKTPLQKIKTWLKSKGYTLDLRKGLKWQTNLVDKVLTGDPNTFFDHRLKRAEKISMLLHECGHIEKWTNGGPQGTPWDADLLLPPTKLDEKAPRSWYIAIVREEIVAWDDAVVLANKMKISGLSSAMKRMRRKCLTSYIKWAAARGDHSIGMRKK